MYGEYDTDVRLQRVKEVAAPNIYPTADCMLLFYH